MFLCKVRGGLSGLEGSSKGFELGLKVVGERRFKANDLAGAGMNECEKRRVKKRTRMGWIGPSVVDALAKKGMASLGDVNANLVLSTGLEATLDKRCGAEGFHQAHVRHALLRVEGWVSDVVFSCAP